MRKEKKYKHTHIYKSNKSHSTTPPPHHTTTPSAGLDKCSIGSGWWVKQPHSPFLRHDGMEGASLAGDE